KAFNATEAIKDKFHTENINYSSLGRKMAYRQQLASPVSEFLGVTMVAIIVLYGGSLVITNQSELAAAEFIAYIAIFSQLMRPAKAITDSFSTIHSGIAAGERVLKLIDEKPEIQDVPDGVILKDFKESIQLENISFSYPGRPVLKSINLTIQKGKTVALVGPSGGGTPPPTCLSPQFIEAHGGRLSLYGHDLRQVNTDCRRALIGVVSSECLLFNDTIGNNSAFGSPHATMEEIVAAAKIANAHDF